MGKDGSRGLEKRKTTPRAPSAQSLIPTTAMSTKSATCENGIGSYNDLTKTEQRSIERRARRLAPGNDFLGVDLNGRIHYYSSFTSTAYVFESVADTEPVKNDLSELPPHVPRRRLTWVELVSERFDGNGWRELRMRPAVQKAHEVKR